LTAAEAASSSLLERLFPALAPVTEEKISQHLTALASSKEGGAEVEQLKREVEHYKTVLAQTESMLTSLQSSVEAAEADWILKMEAANKELIEATASSSSLAAKVAELEAELAKADQAGQMQSQLAALQAQLAAQEEEKTVLHTRNTELSAKAGAMATQVEELSKGNTGLQAALVVAQEAVEKERGGVKALQEQLTAGKEVVNGNGTEASAEVLQ